MFSTELGAHRYFAYAATWPLIINDCQQDYAGFVNRIVTHGYPYSGWRPDVQWPGTTTFEWTYSEMWGPRQPSWQYAREFGDWIGRTQLILQSGVPRVDVGIYRHKYLSVDIKHYGMGENVFWDQSLAEEGFSYVSVSPSLLPFDNAVVTDGLLARDGPGFSAFIVDNSTNITVQAVNRFLEYADQGFPILFVGDVPEITPYYNKSADDYVKASISKLLGYSTVKNFTAETDVVPALRELGILPAAHNLSPSTILYVHRVDNSSSVDYFWTYNSDIYNEHSTLVSFAADTTRIPYSLNAWTGEIRPIVNYTRNDDRVTTWISLRSNASTIVAFAPEGFFANVSVPSVTVESTDVEYLNYSCADKAIVVRSSVNGAHSLALSNNQTSYFNASSIPAATTLGPWQLVVQDWLPNPDPWNNYTSVYAYHNFTLNELVPWYNISSTLANSSGVGTYTTSFHWPLASNSSAVGAWLDLGFVFMTARVWINDQWTGPIDVYNPVLDIGPFLTNGTNDVRIEVSTTLRNRLIQVNVTESWEQKYPYAATYGPQPYGLQRPVTLEPYAETKIFVS